MSLNAFLHRQVNLEKEEGTVEYNPSVVSAEAVADMIDDMGFEATLQTTSPTTSKKSKKNHSVFEQSYLPSQFLHRSQKSSLFISMDISNTNSLLSNLFP